MAVTTTTQVNAAGSPYYDRLLLMRARPFLAHMLFAQMRPLPRKEGSQIKFRRYSSLSTATTPLTEGVTPSGSQLSKTDITATVSQYGDYIEISDVVDMTVEDPVITESVEILGQQFGETLDEVVREILSSTASATNCSNGANGNSPTEITKADIDGVVKTLMGNNAQMITEMVDPSGNFGTVPLAPSFWGICDTDVTDDIANVSNFVSTQEYGQKGAILEGEWGATGRVRWVATSVGKATTESPVQYHNFIMGRNAYGATEVEGSSAKTIIRPYGSGDDPLEQRATVGWKTLFVSRILNDNFIQNLECTHS